MMKLNSLLIAFFLISCNPVKQILRDQAKFDLIKDEVIRKGLCANDTTFITASDTLIQYDTTVQKEIEITQVNDTTIVTKWRDIVKKIVIRDTIKSVVVDNARINVLQADLRVANAKADEYKAKAEKRLSWLILIVVAIGLYVFFKIKP